MAEGILRQSYDSTGRKIYPLTVIDGILRSVDVNVMDAHSRGAYAIIDSMKNYDVDFAEADLTTLDVMTRTWDESTRSYSNIVPILSVNDSGFKVDSGKSSTFTGVIKALAPVYNGGKVEFGNFDEEAVQFTPTGRFSTKDESNVLSGKIELFNSNSDTPFFVVENGQLSWKTQFGNGLTVNGSQLTYSGSSVVIGDLSAQTSDLTVGRDVTVGRNLHVKRDASLDGSLKVGGGITFNGRLDANADASIKKRLYVYDPSVSGSQLFDVSSDGARVSVNTKITKNLTVNGVITAEDVDSHNLTTNIDELNLAGNLDSDSLYFNYRAGNGINQIYMCGGTSSGTSSGNLTTVISKSLQVGMNSSSYSDSSLLLWTNTSGSPSIVFQRGTYSDGYTDWRLVDDSGILKVQFRDDSTGWKNSAHFKDGGIYIFGDQPSNANRFISSDATDNIYVHTDGKVPLVVNTTEVRRGYASGNDGISLGTLAIPWNKIYGKDQYALDHIYVGGGSNHSGKQVTVDWDSISARTNGSPSTLYLSYGGGPTNVNGQMNTKDVIPQSNNTYNIGSSTYRYKKGYYNSLDVLNPWDVPNRQGDADPIIAGMDSFIGGNRGCNLKWDDMSFSYIVRGGELYISGEYSEKDRFNLLNKYVSIPLRGEGSTCTTSWNLNIYLRANEDSYPYFNLKNIAINVTKFGWYLQVGVYTKKTSDSNYTYRGTYPLAGWSGWNSIPMDFSFGNTSTNEIKLVFSIYGNEPTSYTNTPIIRSIRLLGTDIWADGGYYMARYGHIYDWDKDQHAYFPNVVSATGGFLTGKNIEFTGGSTNGYINTTTSSTVLRIGRYKPASGNAAVQLLVGTPGGGFSGSEAGLEVQGGANDVITMKPRLHVEGYAEIDKDIEVKSASYGTIMWRRKFYLGGWSDISTYLDLTNNSHQSISFSNLMGSYGTYYGKGLVKVGASARSGTSERYSIKVTNPPACTLFYMAVWVYNSSGSYELDNVEVYVGSRHLYTLGSVGQKASKSVEMLIMTDSSGNGMCCCHT